MKLVKLLPFYGLFLITLSCSNQITSINPSNIHSLAIENGINIINAIKSSNVEKVKELLSKNINLKVQNLNGETPLMIASANGNKEIVELICNKYKFDNISKLPEFDWKKASSYVGIVSPIYNKYTTLKDDYLSFINYSNEKSFNKSALLFAIENGHTDIAKYLISEGSDLSVKDSNKNNLIFYSLILRNTEFIDKVISKNKNSINEKDIYGNTPLMVASFLGDLEMVQYLISKGVYINEKNNFGNTAIMLASGCNYNKFYDLNTQKDINNSDIIDNVEKTINLIYLKSKNKNKPFSVYKEIINLLIKNNAYLHDKNNSNMTPFILASMYGNKEILELMIENGSNISEKDEFGNNALLYSARSGNYDTFKYLISKGIHINYENNNKNNALILASSYNHFDIVKDLISKGVNINDKNNLNETALMVALKNNNTDIGFYLINNGASIDVVSTNNETTLINSILYDYENLNREMINYLISKGINLDIKTIYNKNALFLSIIKNDFDLLKNLLDKGVSINILNEFNQSPIEIASINNNYKIFKLLYDSNSSIFSSFTKKREIIFYNCLINALYNKNIDIINFILEKKELYNLTEEYLQNILDLSVQNLNIENFKSLYLLLQKDNFNISKIKIDNLIEKSILSGNYSVLDYLLKDIVNINSLNKYNKSNILDFAIDTGYPEIVSILIKNGALVNVKSRSNESILSKSLKKRFFNISKILLDYGAELDNNEILLAVQNVDFEKVTLLLQYNSDINFQDELGNTPLISSIKNRITPILDVDIEVEDKLFIDNRIIKILLENKPNLNIENKEGLTPLILSAQNNLSDILEILINNSNLELDKKDIYDNNALFYAISNRSIDITSLLLKKGSNPNIIFNKTKTPLNFAIELNEPNLVKLLLEHKANVNKKDLNGVTPLSLALKIKNDQIINSLKWYGAK